jgi:hypothetical protein
LSIRRKGYYKIQHQRAAPPRNHSHLGRKTDVKTRDMQPALRINNHQHHLVRSEELTINMTST